MNCCDLNESLYALDEFYFVATNTDDLTAAQWDALTENHNEQRQQLWRISGRPSTQPRPRPR